MSPGRISASFWPEPGADLGRERRLDVLELGRLLGDRVDDPPVAVADVDRHQLAVEVEDPLALGRVQVDALGAVDRDRVERALDRPREERVLPGEGDDLLARHPRRGADAHRSSSGRACRRPACVLVAWRPLQHSAGAAERAVQPVGIASARRRIAAAPRSAWASVVIQLETEIRIARMAVPGRAAEPDLAVLLDRRDDRRGPRIALRRVAGRVLEAHQDLVEDDVVEDPDAGAARRARPRTAGRRPSCGRSAPRPRVGPGCAAPPRPGTRAPGARTPGPSCTGRARRPRSRRSTPPRASSRRGGRPRRATNDSPESYGTLSHLWASVVHESASPTPSTRWRREGSAAAHSPNAPSTWSQPPFARTASTIGGSGSNAPVLTLPAWAVTSAGRSRSREDGRQRLGAHPALVVGRDADARGRGPCPSIWSAAKIVTCDSSLTTTGISGAPNRPCRSTSQPAFASSAWRPAARPVNDAIVAPVVYPTLALLGQAEQVDQPGAGRLLGDRGGRADDVQAGVLVPGAGQPVRGEGRRHAAADHEPEVARPGAPDEPALGVRRELVHDGRRVQALLGQRPDEAGAQRLERGRRPDRRLVQRRRGAPWHGRPRGRGPRRSPRSWRRRGAGRWARRVRSSGLLGTGRQPFSARRPTAVIGQPRYVGCA